MEFIQRLYTAGLSSRTILELMPCRDAPSDENSDAALERMALEPDRLSAHIEELLNTRDALDGLMAPPGRTATPTATPAGPRLRGLEEA
ncbi:hypothetical protein SAMN04487983_106711 [Streptomyces sp. yr375]|nr:hypothetical protein SAMN04487983_106711 [Streptomyces sp. yr375]